jgi:hypothetical protein
MKALNIFEALMKYQCLPFEFVFMKGGEKD